MFKRPQSGPTNTTPASPIGPQSDAYPPQPVANQTQPVADQPQSVPDQPQSVADQPLPLLDRPLAELTRMQFDDIMENWMNNKFKPPYKDLLAAAPGFPLLHI